MKKSRVASWLLLLSFGVALVISGCQSQPAPPPVTYNQYQLEYLLLDKFPNIFWNDSDFWPIVREGVEQQNAIAQFSTIKANATEFSTILQRLGLSDKPDYTDEEKLLVYRQHKLLTRAVQVTPATGGYQFVLYVGEGQGERIEGTITNSGNITITKREPSFNTHPICLAKDTLIDTPTGPVPVQELRAGMAIWTIDSSGNSVAGTVTETTSTPVLPSFQMVKLTLSDGRTVTASPGHPTAEGKAIGEYKVGDSLDGATVMTVEHVPNEVGSTYDILPSGGTGLYWANGILLKSTLAGKH